MLIAILIHHQHLVEKLNYRSSSKEQRFAFHVVLLNQGVFGFMDERQTLRMGGWIMGTLLTLIFILNAVSYDF